MSEPLKVGLVGTGGIARRHLTAYMEHPDRVQLTAVCDIVESAAQEYAEKAGIGDIYLDIDEMLREANVDAVDICTSHDTHAPLTVAAAQAGKHVIVEKAMATSVQGCRDMVAAADEAGVTLMVAQHLRYSPEARAAKRLIDDGKLGDIEAVRTELFGGGNIRRRRRHRQGHWMDDAQQSGGGMLMVTSVHHIDLLRYYIGNVTRVTAICKSLQPHMINGAEDLVAAILEFENGAIGEVWAKGNSLAPAGRTYMVLGNEGTFYASTPTEAQRIDERNGVSPTRHFGSIMVSLTGDEELDPNNDQDLKKIYQPPFEPLSTSDIDLPSTDYFVNEILHFEECCRTGAEPMSSGRDNIETIKIIMGIYESSRTGKPVDLDDL